MAEATAPVNAEHLRWAVCPRIERTGASRRPQLFALKSEALKYSESEEAQEFFGPVGDCPAPPVPARYLADYSGPRCTQALRDSLSPEVVISPLDLGERIRRALLSRPTEFACCLGADWRFEEIETEAQNGPGHNYSGSDANIATIVIQAVHDVERAFQRLHPNAPKTAVADFWRSWQVQQHIAWFCRWLGETCARNDAPEEAERVRQYVLRQLAAFAYEVEMLAQAGADGGGVIGIESSPSQSGRFEAKPILSVADAETTGNAPDTGASTSAPQRTAAAHGQDSRTAMDYAASERVSDARKGDMSLIRDKTTVNFLTAQAYLGISERQRQKLVRSGVLMVTGKGHNRKITRESLLRYLPPENPN